MQSAVRDVAPKAEETLAKYIQRLRAESTSTQKELSLKAGIHVQTIRKIEAGLTSRLNQKARSGLAAALGIPPDYLDAVVKKVPITNVNALKFCPQCWTPGTTPDPMWVEPRSKYCFACATALRNRCMDCREPILSLKFKFCPYCGTSYKQAGEKV
jgi:DNA-binding XRE family transcriptional regulator